jgi:hypothetical protein
MHLHLEVFERNLLSVDGKVAWAHWFDPVCFGFDVTLLEEDQDDRRIINTELTLFSQNVAPVSAPDIDARS